MACHGSGVCEWVCVCTVSVLIVSHPLLCEERAGSKLLIFTASPCSRQGRQLELLMRAMALPSVWSEMRVGILLLSVLGLLSARLVGAGQDSGSAIPAESRYLLHPVLPAFLRCTLSSHTGTQLQGNFVLPD